MAEPGEGRGARAAPTLNFSLAPGCPAGAGAAQGKLLLHRRAAAPKTPAALSLFPSQIHYILNTSQAELLPLLIDSSTSPAVATAASSCTHFPPALGSVCHPVSLASDRHGHLGLPGMFVPSTGRLQPLTARPCWGWLRAKGEDAFFL